MNTEYILYIFIFVFGLIIGSFLNCVIYRLEHNKKLTGRSFCPNCKHKLHWKDLFPVFSFLFLGGKCKYCRKKISWQYPIVEISTALMFLLIFNFVNFNFVNLIFLFYISASLIAIFIYDLKHYIIPDKILLPAIIITLVFRFLIFYAFLKYVLAALIAAGFFFIIFFFSKGRAMGFGDVKLAVLMGLLLGWPNILVALFLAFFFGAVVGLVLMILKKKGLKSKMPFGPFLIIGTFLALFWGQELINWYLKLLLIT